MKRLRKILLIAGGILAAVVLLLTLVKQRDTYRCRECGSSKDVFQWGLTTWVGPGIPLTPAYEHIHEDRFQTDFFPTDHVHQWVFAQGSPYLLFGTVQIGCGIGAGRNVCKLGTEYSHDEKFHTFIQGKIKDGSLERSNLIAMAASPPFGETNSFQKDADALMETFDKH